MHHWQHGMETIFMHFDRDDSVCKSVIISLRAEDNFQISKVFIIFAA